MRIKLNSNEDVGRLYATPSSALPHSPNGTNSRTARFAGPESSASSVYAHTETESGDLKLP